MPFTSKIKQTFLKPVHETLSHLSGSANVSEGEDEGAQPLQQQQQQQQHVEDGEGASGAEHSHKNREPSTSDGRAINNNNNKMHHQGGSHSSGKVADEYDAHNGRGIDKDGEKEKEAASPKGSIFDPNLRRRSSEDTDEDTAKPYGDWSDTNFFSSFLNNTSLCSGFGSIGNLRKLNFDDLLKRKDDDDVDEHEMVKDHSSKSEHPHIQKFQEKLENLKPNGLLEHSIHPRQDSGDFEHKAHPVYAKHMKKDLHGGSTDNLSDEESSETEDDSEGGEDEEEEEEEEFLANRLTPSSTKATLSSTSNEQFPTKTTPSAEDATDTSTTSNVTSYSTIDAGEAESPSNEKAHTTVKVDSQPPGLTEEQNLTPLQKSVIQNLDPQSIREGVLIKIKHKSEDETTPDLTESKRKLRYTIAEKLKRTFHLKDNDIFYGNYSAWLVKDVLLQGHLYLTKDALLYFAFLPKRYSLEGSAEVQNLEDPSNIVCKGNLGMKTGKFGDATFSTVLTHRYWSILRPETLTVYSSSTDLYFPILVIDLRTCLYAEVIDKYKYKDASTPVSRSGLTSGWSSPPAHLIEDSASASASDLKSMFSDESIGATEDSMEVKSTNVWFKLATKRKTYKFQCDNLYSARRWCSNLTKLIFQLNNANLSGEVLVKIPIANIIEFKKRSIFDEEVEDTVEEDANDTPLSLSIKYHANDVVEKRKRDKLKEKIKNEADDTAEVYFLFPKNGSDLFSSFEEAFQNSANISALARGNNSLLNSVRKERTDLEKSISTLTPSSNKLVKAVIDSNTPEFGKPHDESALRKFGKSLARPKMLLKPSSPSNSGSIDRVMTDHLDEEKSHISLPIALSERSLRKLEISFETTFKNLQDASTRYEQSGQIVSAIDDLPLPSNLPDKYSRKNQSLLSKKIKALSSFGTKFSANPLHYVVEDHYYVANKEERNFALKHFHEHFSLFNSQLVASYYCHVMRGVPIYGKLYVSDYEICFRSLLPGVATKMIIPMMDIESVDATEGSRLNYSGAKIVVQGVEEMLIEFAYARSRDDFIDVALTILDKLHKNDGFRPKPHQWGSNYNVELAKTRMEYSESERRSIEQDQDNKRELQLAEQRVAMARIKMFEDRLNAASGLDVPIVLEDSPFFQTEMKPSTSYKITLLTIGSRGDVQPYIALGVGLQKEGHTVTIATHSEFQEWIEKHGLRFKEIAGDPGELMSFMVGHSTMSVSFLKDAQAKFKNWIKKLLTTSWEACQGTEILIESPSAMAGIHIAEALVIPYFRAFTMPWTRTRAYPQAFFVPEQKKGGSYNYLTHVIFENIFWKGIQGLVNRWRLAELDLPKTNLFRMQQTKVPFLYNVSPCVMPPANDFPSWVKVTGYWFLDEGGKEYSPPKELLDFMAQAVADDKKIVYIGFGSIVVNDAASLTKAIVEAVLEADVRCILNKGWSDRENKDKNKIEVDLPPEVYNSGSVPHDWLFPRVDAAVHHGGSGTTGATLKAGTPSIIKPFFGDQFFYAQRIEDMGVGISLRKLTKKSLAGALNTVTEDLNIVNKAKKVSHQINQEKGVLTAIEAMYLELEYTRNLTMVKEIHNQNYKRHHPDFRSGTTTAEVSEDEEEDEEEDSDEDEDEDEDGKEDEDEDTDTDTDANNHEK
ncbi:uncharacterized protein LODBEIA_P10090 [Lodderomyces beijingensis]|uniref:Sterol 3-beta-glucosyltransferase n=1 Tax=Lodderomyces beijingensis TaxID=1775926 RepID=A0ABP0ZI05_9ASCO